MSPCISDRSTSKVAAGNPASTVPHRLGSSRSGLNTFTGSAALDLVGEDEREQGGVIKLLGTSQGEAGSP